MTKIRNERTTKPLRKKIKQTPARFCMETAELPPAGARGASRPGRRPWLVAAWSALAALPVCWVISALLHGTILAGLGLYAGRELVQQRATAGFRAGVGRVREVLADIKRHHSGTLARQLADLAAIQHELTSLQAAKQDQLDRLTAELDRDAAGRARELQETAARAQQAAADAQRRATEAAAPTTAPANDNPQAQTAAAAGEIQQALASQHEALLLQRQAADAIGRVLPAETRAAQEQAAARQNEAIKASERAATAAAATFGQHDQLAQAKAAEQTAAERLAALARTRDTATAARDRESAAAAAALQARAAAAAALGQSESALRDETEKLRAQEAEARRQFEVATRAADSSRRATEQAERQRRDTQQNRDRLERDAASAQKSADRARTDLLATLDQTAGKQQAALADQTAAAAALTPGQPPTTDAGTDAQLAPLRELQNAVASRQNEAVAAVARAREPIAPAAPTERAKPATARSDSPDEARAAAGQAAALMAPLVGTLQQTADLAQQTSQRLGAAKDPPKNSRPAQDRATARQREVLREGQGLPGQAARLVRETARWQQAAQAAEQARQQAATAAAAGAAAAQAGDRDRATAEARKKEAEAAQLALRQRETELRALADRARQAETQARRAVEETGRQAAAATQRAADAERQAGTGRAELEASQRNATAAADAVGRTISALVPAIAEAAKAQGVAREEHALAMQKLAAALEKQPAADRPPEQPPSGQRLPEIPPPTAPPPDASLAQLYRQAVADEQRLAATYRNIRAADLAMIRQLPVDQALELTKAASAERPDLGAALEREIGATAEADDARETVRRALSEVQSIVALATAMRQQVAADAAAAAQGVSVSLAKVKAQGTHQGVMAALAAEDAGLRAKDLSGPMREAARAQADDGGGGGGLGKGAAAPAAAADPPKDDARPSAPPVFPANFTATPSRKLGGGGVAAAFTFVDSWYVIGPWDNAGRQHIDTKFPPETVVDLDATYAGKLGQPIRWEFQQAARPEIVPLFPGFRRPPNAGEYAGIDYIIYYAYTEIRSDGDRDVWVAVGSDDYSKLWINDQLVWASGREHKWWRVDEGLRRVHLQRGANRVLFRIENGHMVTAFSLVLCPDRR